MKTKSKRHPDLYVGTWCAVDITNRHLEYRIRKVKKGYSVSVLDQDDDQKGEVFEEKWDAKKGIFSFAVHWPPTGRFLRIKMMLIEDDKMDMTFTFTDSEILSRKKKLA